MGLFKLKKGALLLVLVLPLLLGACGGGTSGTTATAPGSPASVTTVTSESTSTAASGTESTQNATTIATAEQTTTTKGAVTAQAIVDRMKSLGLPVGDIASYDENTDPNQLLGRPHQYTQKANFTDTELDAPSLDNGGTVEVFANADDAKARKDYIDAISKDMPMVGYYTYQSGNYILRIAFDVPPTRAKDYEAAFLEAVRGG
jgi:hypothetical protein